MRIPPLEVLLTWPAPNYDDPITRGNASVIINAIFLFLVILAVSLRFYCRISGGPMRFGWDDTMIALALVFTIGMTTVVILAEKAYGWDRHIWDIEAQLVTRANIIAFVAKIVFTLAATFTRLSLCCFYYRLVKDIGIPWFQWVVHFTVAFSVAICITFVFLSIFLCTPVAYYWQYPPTMEGSCLDEGTVTLVSGVLNIVTDVITTVVPLPLVMRLRMPLKQRIGVSVLFGLGFIVIIAGSIRTFYIWKGLMDSYDETWYAYPLWICAAVEIDVGVICACAPALKTLLHFSHPKQLLSRHFQSRRNPDPHLEQPDKAPPPSLARSYLNRTLPLLPSLPWSSHSRTNRGSVKLRSQDEEAWSGTTKTASGNKTLSCSDESELSVLKPTKKPSLELEKLNHARTRSTLEQDVPIGHVHRVDGKVGEVLGT